MYLESLFIMFPGPTRVCYWVHVSAHCQCTDPRACQSWLVSAARYPGCQVAPKYLGLLNLPRVVRHHRTPGHPGWTIWAPNQGPDPLGPHGGESRIEPGSTPGTHFSLLHSPGLLSVGAFLLLLLLPVPHNLAPSVTLARISSSLPRHDPDERSPSIPTAPNSSSPLRGAIQTLLAIKSFPRGWFTGTQQDTVQDREGRRRETETAQPRSDRRLSLALHLYRLLYAAFNSSQRSHIFPGQDVVGRPANAVSYQITRQRNALHVIATRCTHHRHDSTPLYSPKHRQLAIERRPDSGLTGVYLSRRVLTALARSPGCP